MIGMGGVLGKLILGFPGRMVMPATAEVTLLGGMLRSHSRWQQSLPRPFLSHLWSLRITGAFDLNWALVLQRNPSHKRSISKQDLPSALHQEQHHSIQASEKR